MIHPLLRRHSTFEKKKRFERAAAFGRDIFVLKESSPFEGNVFASKKKSLIKEIFFLGGIIYDFPPNTLADYHR